MTQVNRLLGTRTPTILDHRVKVDGDEIETLESLDFECREKAERVFEESESCIDQWPAPNPPCPRLILPMTTNVDASQYDDEGRERPSPSAVEH